MTQFAAEVYVQTRRIPAGFVASYGLIAFLAGRPGAARAVGAILRSNDDDSGATPCHRVVFKDGSVCAGYAFGGPEIQRALLEGEGVSFLPDGRVDMAKCAWYGA